MEIAVVLLPFGGATAGVRRGAKSEMSDLGKDVKV